MNKDGKAVESHGYCAYEQVVKELWTNNSVNCARLSTWSCSIEGGIMK